MVIYEVNLYVDEEIAEEYGAWLKKHIRAMLGIKGFQSAVLYELEDVAEDRVNWSVHYYLEDRAAVDHYFEHHAERMRQDALDRFKDQFAADRRVLYVAERFDA